MALVATSKMPQPHAHAYPAPGAARAMMQPTHFFPLFTAEPRSVGMRPETAAFPARATTRCGGRVLTFPRDLGGLRRAARGLWAADGGGRAGVAARRGTTHRRRGADRQRGQGA